VAKRRTVPAQIAGRLRRRARAVTGQKLGRDLPPKPVGQIEITDQPELGDLALDAGQADTAGIGFQ
jgi:hypothetical protein